ncbi:unnamed protein product [Ceutorhynchus assimilis]|uniref:Malate dehydrogenase, mitochondrial n=1 Tax=Ceutorhynchus assimilis TaxID=467358 RepID=A0A9N9MG27_9CUCU|nr:unnamed protein product [Ceutorhynchus assimilis]
MNFLSKLYSICFNKALLQRQNHKMLTKSYSTGSGLLKVTIVGAAGKVGQPLALALKQSPLIDELCLHDLKPTTALGLELNHIDTRSKVTVYSGKDNLKLALKNTKVLAVVASAPGADTLSFEKMWMPNSEVIKEIMTEVRQYCPKALIAIATNPINSIMPLASEMLKKGGIFNPNGVFGVTSVDAVRANTFVANVQGLEPECVEVPVVGGHSTETIVPLLSQAKPCADFTNSEIEDITARIRMAHEDLIKLKPSESGALSSAFATARFIVSLIKALQGQPNVIEYAYVKSSVHPYLKYLSTPLLLGMYGVQKNLGFSKMTDYEQCMFDNAVTLIAKDIKRGEHSAGVHEPGPPCDPCTPIRRGQCPYDWCNIKN